MSQTHKIGRLPQPEDGRSIIELPLPPSVNRLWQSVKGRAVSHAPYRKWLDQAAHEFLIQQPRKCLGAVTIEITFGFPDSRRRDLDSLKKPILNALAKFGIIENDSAKIVRDLQLRIGAGFIGARIEISPSVVCAFQVGETVVTTQGVGRVSGIERHEVKGVRVELLAIELPNGRLLVPKDRVENLRPLASRATIANALSVLGTKPRSLRGPWLAAAQVYRRRLQSGDPLSVATVVRDLYGSVSASEAATFFEGALEHLAREVAAVERITIPEATNKIKKALGRTRFNGPGKLKAI